MPIRMLLILILIPVFPLQAQDVGIKEYPALGIKFSIPEGWFGRETEIGYLLGSNTEAGFILLITHESKTMEAMKQEAANGINDQNGTALSLSGSLEPIGKEGLGGEFTGTVEFQQAKSYIAAVLNPFGKGVMVMAATDNRSYSPRYPQLARQVAASLRFAEPKEAPVVKKWRDTLKGAKLTYLTSSGGVDYSGYSGSSSRTEILLCANQQFSYYDSNSSAFDINAGFGSANNSNAGRGKWEVGNDANGNPLLLLHFNNGREFQYRINYRDNKTFLGDTRYFRTYDHGACQ